MVNLKKYLSVLLLVLPNFAFSADREATVCGWFKERMVFTMWSSMAPNLDASRVAGHDLIQRTEFTTADDKILRGINIRHRMNTAWQRNLKATFWWRWVTP